MSSNNPILEIGFWHPFGPHGGETAEQIIKRKKEEIEKNGWTLWSFQNRKNTHNIWLKNIIENNPINILAFCSAGKGSQEPKGETKEYRHYKPAGEDSLKEIPSDILVLHPSNKMEGSAFIVKNIIFPAGRSNKTNIEWLQINGQWRNDRIPTRGEYLIKIGQGQPMGNYRAILELQYPYIAEVKI